MELQYYKVEKKQRPKKIPCPYNDGCACERKECYKCGWNPKVSLPPQWERTRRTELA